MNLTTRHNKHKLTLILSCSYRPTTLCQETKWPFRDAQSRMQNIEIRLRNDLYCARWGVELYSLTHSQYRSYKGVNDQFAKG